MPGKRQTHRKSRRQEHGRTLDFYGGADRYCFAAPPDFPWKSAVPLFIWTVAVGGIAAVCSGQYRKQSLEFIHPLESNDTGNISGGRQYRDGPKSSNCTYGCTGYCEAKSGGDRSKTVAGRKRSKRYFVTNG